MADGENLLKKTQIKKGSTLASKETTPKGTSQDSGNSETDRELDVVKKHLDEAFKKSKEENKRLQEENKRLQEENKRLQEENAKLKQEQNTCSHQMNKSLVEKEKKQTLLMELDNNLEKLNAENTSLQTKCQKVEVEHIKLEQEKNTLSHQIKTMVVEKDDKHKLVQTMEFNLEKLNAENSRLQTELRRVKDENGLLRQKNNMLSQQMDNFTVDKEQRNKLVMEMEKINAEKIRLQAELRKVKVENEKAIQSIHKDYAFTVDKICKDNKRKYDALVEQCEQDNRRKTDQIKEITKERDDLRTRFSKLAGDKLTDQNADIADLSDPNRAMKLSEKFGTLYDDQWTDAFECLKKIMSVKEAITLLIRILQDCWNYCMSLRDIQMESLKNVLLHPAQDMAMFDTVPKRLVGGLKNKPRIGSKDEGTVREVRRKIGVSECVVEEVKRAFLQETKTWDQKGYERKQLEQCTPYLQTCAQVCWLMAIHCPPLYMKLDVKQGDRLDLNYFSNYTTPSDKIDYLVWPPLFNEENGGLLKKGVAEGIKMIKKK